MFRHCNPFLCHQIFFFKLPKKKKVNSLVGAFLLFPCHFWPCRVFFFYCRSRLDGLFFPIAHCLPNKQQKKKKNILKLLTVYIHFHLLITAKKVLEQRKSELTPVEIHVNLAQLLLNISINTRISENMRKIYNRDRKKKLWMMYFKRVGLARMRDSHVKAWK